MSSYLDIKIFADLIRAKRGDRGLREIALITGISPSTISRVERGAIPDVTTFLALCNWLDVPPGEFIKNTDLQVKRSHSNICNQLRTDTRIDSSVGNAIAILIEKFTANK